MHNDATEQPKSKCGAGEGEKKTPLADVLKTTGVAVRRYCFHPREFFEHCFAAVCNLKVGAAVAAVLVAAYAVWFFTSEHYNSKIAFLSGRLQERENSVRQLAYKISDLKIERNELRRQKDAELFAAQSERDNALQRIALIQAMPGDLLSIYTNIAANAPTNFQELHLIVGQLTNALSRAISTPELELWENDHPLTNGSVISLAENRSLNFHLRNRSDEVSALGAFISFIAPSALHSTNLLVEASQWRELPLPVAILNDERLINTTLKAWDWKAEEPIYHSDGLHYAGTLRFTNFNLPVIQVEVRFGSVNSRIQRYTLTLTF